MSRVSETSDNLILLDSVEDFCQHSLRALERARRRVVILSDRLDPLVYDRDDIHSALSQFVRRSRYSDLRILVRDTQDMIERGHRIVRLHQRLPSKAAIRKIAIEPDNTRMGYLCVDRTLLVYKNDDTVHRGFVDYRGAQQGKALGDEFDRIWEYGTVEPGLRILHL